jgi:hypothetical protein
VLLGVAIAAAIVKGPSEEPRALETPTESPTFSPTATVTFSGPPPFATPTTTGAGTQTTGVPTSTMTALPRTDGGNLWAPAAITLGLAALAGAAASRREA